MLVLGLSGNFSREDTDLAPNMTFAFHDSAACLINDGVLVAAVEEERLNRIKKTNKFPINAIRACLDIGQVSARQLDAVAYNYREDHIDSTLNHLYTAEASVPARYSREIIGDALRHGFGVQLGQRLLYTEHHTAHAMSSLVRSGMDEALVVVMDGRGEEHSTTVFHGSGHQLETLAQYPERDSLGTLYYHGTQLLGYQFGDEYKVMGLAPYGDPRTFRGVFEQLYSLEPDGRYRLHPSEVGQHITGYSLLGPTLLEHGFLPRRRGEKFSRQHMDFAAALQETLERVALHIIQHWVRTTGMSKLCFVGGVAHNSTLNGVLLRSGIVDEMFVHPASHDAGAGEGAALDVAYRLGGLAPRRRMRSASLGPLLGGTEEIAQRLAQWEGLIEFEYPTDIVDTAADLLADGAVLGWAMGAAEFGPRALGNRSILADPRPAENKDRINAAVKKREGYRPFAPVVTPAAAETFFELPGTGANYDFMSFVVPVREHMRERLAAVTHVDGTARLQIIDPKGNRRFHRLVARFGELTGTPVLLNTSFNNNAEPIVQTVDDVVTSFLTTELDYLVIEDILVRRRPGVPDLLDELVPRLRPVTRLDVRVRADRSGNPATTYEVSLDHWAGDRAGISPDAFAVLRHANGRSTLAALATPVGGLSPMIRRELHELWGRRFFALTPPGYEQ